MRGVEVEVEECVYIRNNYAKVDLCELLLVEASICVRSTKCGASSKSFTLCEC